MTSHRLRPLIAGLCIAALTSCASTTGAADQDPPAGSNAKVKADKPKGKSRSSADKTLTFGEAFTWDDGITVKVGPPQSYKPTQYASAPRAASFVAFDVTLVNKTGKPFDPNLLYMTLQSGNRQASQVFDSGKLPDPPSTTLLDGREAKWRVAWGVKAPQDLVMELSPDAGIEHKPAIWATS